MNRAVLHLLHGNLKDGWRDYAARLKIAGKVPVAEHGLPRWDGSSLKRDRLLVTAEQGVGDQIMFASLIAELRRARRRTAASILGMRAAAGLAVRALVSGRDRAGPGTPRRRAASRRTRYGWLKACRRRELRHRDGQRCRASCVRLDRAFPNPHAYLDARCGRSCALARAFPVGPAPSSASAGAAARPAAIARCNMRRLSAGPSSSRDWPGTVVCVQYDATAEEIAELERTERARASSCRSGIDQKNELDRACAMLASLDAVVSAPTAVSWLAAARRRRDLQDPLRHELDELRRSTMSRSRRPAPA